MTDKTTVDHTVRSTSSRPDLDWSQVKETVLMLKLAAAQVEFSMRDGNKSVDVLTDTFTGMASSMQAIDGVVQELIAHRGLDGDKRDIMVEHCNSISVRVQQAIVAFQFYDKLVQRIDHVVASLSQLADLVGEPSRLYSPLEWQKLQIAIRDRYTMAQERELFDALMNGEDVQSVLDRLQRITQEQSNDDIELF
jgi:hypothetical protein